MADPANFEALQAQKAEDTRRAVHSQAVRGLLVSFRPHDDYGQLDYRELLHAARDVLTRELEQLGEADHA